MHNFLYHLIDLKVSIAGVIFAVINFSNIDISIKIIGSILFVGYTARRWYLLEKDKNKKDEL
jgi:hypothetical protein